MMFNAHKDHVYESFLRGFNGMYFISCIIIDILRHGTNACYLMHSCCTSVQSPDPLIF